MVFCAGGKSNCERDATRAPAAEGRIACWVVDTKWK